MRDFFRKLSLRAKLLCIALLPLLFIVYLSLDLYGEKSRNVLQTQLYLNRIHQSVTISRLIDQLQKEGRYSFDYALTKVDRKEMLGQRPVTDSLLSELDRFNDSSLKHYRSYTFLEKIDSTRKYIDSGHFDANQVMHFFSSSVFRLNTVQNYPTIIYKDLKEAYSDIVSQKLLSEMVTYQSIIDANIYNLLYTRKYMVETLMGTYGTYEVYKSYENELGVKADQKVLDRFNQIKDHGAMQRVDGYLSKIFSTFKVDSSYTYQNWKTVSDNSLNELRNLQMSLLDNAESQIQAFYKVETGEKNKAIIYLIGITALVALLVFYILHIINISLKELSAAAQKLADGNTDIRIPFISNDAVGRLATSLWKVDQKNKELAMAASKIGEGNFDVKFSPRSSEDLLGTAVLKMKDDLLQFTDDLKKSKEEFEQLADFIPQIVWVTNNDGEIIYYNKAWYEITGSNKDNIENSWVPVLHPDDVGIVLTKWYGSIENGEMYEAEYRVKDMRVNEYRWYLGRAVPIIEEDGKILKWFGTGTDIHDQKLQHEKLEELVAKRTLELNRSNEDLQQFAHVASHDLKEPLRKIRTFSDRLVLEVKDTLPEKARVYINKLQNSAGRMVNMIDSILSYSVMNSTIAEKELINLNNILDGITNDLELLIIEKEARLEYDQLPTIKGDKTLVFQLFYNLINNSLKFTKADHEAIIKISAQKVSHQDIKPAMHNGIFDFYWLVTIEDNGIGFNQAYADKMFNAFTRLHSKDKYEGTGLGLALCRRIVDRHEGYIYAEGEEGVGARFYILLPAE
ncbi:ATP-binding protein [Flavisolibacter ginsengisoli]|jgi:PAS domain S-box-containing protein|uniref:histidine kinase n=1 Tax=Flavisolibacter ginsengisoli DSM 18119 TaxID=1121884 RepID=A0A1M4X585_9BACT|nr:ATP-binding protein [Flavisolibacter ginsengisoli]SHE88630.1 PAS domain S-box-containing protein [Flavisolibacter ginsengisoli DSM 18119]